MNNVMLTGYVGNDLEIKGTGSKMRLSFSVFTSTGNKDERIPIPVVVFGNTATFVEKYFAKGKAIEVAGELSHSEWTDKDGNKRSSINVIGRQISFTPANKTPILGQGQQREQGVAPAPGTGQEVPQQNEFFSPEDNQGSYDNFGFTEQTDASNVPW